MGAPAVSGVTEPTRFKYNGDGQLSRITRPDRSVVNVGYDSAGRLDSLVGPAAGTSTFGWDPTTGLLTSAEAPSG